MELPGGVAFSVTLHNSSVLQYKLYTSLYGVLPPSLPLYGPSNAPLELKISNDAPNSAFKCINLFAVAINISLLRTVTEECQSRFVIHKRHKTGTKEIVISQRH